MLAKDLKPAAKLAEPTNKKLVLKLQRLRPKTLDDVVQNLHEEAFDEIDCLECGNCCKTTSPIFQQGDIERLAKYLKMKVATFIDTYLHLDHDGDYVLNSAPCPFLGYDNYCSVYANRPTACREYPHTNRKRFYQLLDLSLKNVEVCPAVYRIMEELKKVYDVKEK